MTDVKKTEKGAVALREEEILKFWNENDIFNKSVEKEAPQGDYFFYDGPPFATGSPHYGHILTSTIKDVVPRYQTMRGYRVERQWGWDCHGLPLENIVEKKLNISGREDILKIGVKKFNDTCREEIAQVSGEWERLIPRLGRWADMKNPYRTMDTTFMESEWWAFKQLHEKGLIYEDYRSMHICPRCETTLAQSEVSEGYKDIKDLSVTAEFPLADEEGTSFLAWTTTPWTLPGNAALAVGVDIDYVTVEKEGKRYILAKEALERLFTEGEYEVISEIKGSELVGKKYTPPFDTYINKESLENRENAWQVYGADFVTTEDGAGIVHIAPAFGADDLALAQKHSIPILKHVGMNGIVVPEVVELAGLSVKPIDDHQSTDVEVVKFLAKKGILFAKEKYEHSYPHCWRCDTPLINYATSSWFVAVEKVKSDLLKYAEDINWTPKHIKKGRWGKWLEGARDWSVSRQRFWANTIPVWRCKKCLEEDVFGSIKELEEKSGTLVTDLHKDVVDEVVYACACGGDMYRVPDVLDTWFNSGSVPFASYHYPFENKEKVDTRIPANFIAEGTDQTRAWFYYQHVLIGAIFGKAAFKNVIVNGMALAEDGKKMSKKLKNYPDPTLMIDTYGADAMRLYMLSSPVVRAEDFRFSEKEIAPVASKVMGRLVNVHSFYSLYKDEIAHEPLSDSTNVLDRWIIARTLELHAEVTSGMDNYELDKATRPLADFVDDLSTWYLRRSRDRLKSDDTEDVKAALQTIRWVLRKYAKICAPFTPFIADWLWQQVMRNDDPESVHLANWCSVKESDKDVLSNMKTVREVVSAALEARASVGIKVRQPLQTLTVSSDLLSVVDDELIQLIKDEINVKEVVVARIGSDVALDTVITDALREEGEVREIIRSVQSARKEAALEPGEAAHAVISGKSDTLVLVTKHAEEIGLQTHTTVAQGDEQEETTVKIESIN